MATILVVDDDPDIAASIVRLLCIAGHEAASVGDGDAALERVALGPPDLLITDMVMPKPDGVTLVLAVKQKAPTLPIIAISGGGGYGLRDELLEIAKELGATVLPKPFKSAALLAAVDRALGIKP